MMAPVLNTLDVLTDFLLTGVSLLLLDKVVDIYILYPLVL